MKRTKLIIIIVLCLVIIYGVWRFNKNRQEVAAVKNLSFDTYTSRGLGFAIEYPKGWTIREGTPGIDPNKYWAVVFTSPEWEVATDDDKQFPNFAVNYYASLDTLLAFEERTLESKTLENFIESSKLMSGARRTTLAGNTAWRAIVHGDDEIDTIFVERGCHVYALGVSNGIGLTDPLAEKMISSFVFTQ